MPDGVPVQVRQLPGGDRAEALQLSENGRLLELELDGLASQLGAGSLLEVERGDRILLGEVLELAGTRVVMRVEHSVDRARLAAVQDVWD